MYAYNRTLNVTHTNMNAHVIYMHILLILEVVETKSLKHINLVPLID